MENRNDIHRLVTRGDSTAEVNVYCLISGKTLSYVTLSEYTCRACFSEGQSSQ